MSDRQARPPRRIWIPVAARLEEKDLAFLLDLEPSQELVLCAEQSWPGFRAYDVVEVASV